MVVLVVSGPSRLLVLLHPLLVGGVLNVVVVSGDDHKRWILITLAGQADVNLEVVHDLADAAASLPDYHGVNPGVDTDLLVHHALKLAHDLQDRVPGLVGVLLVPGDRDDAGVLLLLSWQLDLDIKVVPDLRDDGSSTSDDLGMVVRVNFDLDLE